MPSSMQENVEFDLDRIVRDTFVAEILYHKTVDSTNDSALDLCRREDLRSPFLVLTSQQTSGRGRGTNRWWSAPGALTFSLLIRAADRGLPQCLWPKTSLATGLSVCSALDELLPDGESSLKWPNDVHLRGRKVCGVLVEPGPRSSDMLVVGIGVNVNNTFDNAPDELASTATSLFDVTGRQSDLTEVLVRLLRHLERQWSRLADGDTQLVAEWQSRCALRGRNVKVVTGTRSTAGLCQGIDEDGALVLLTEDGPARLFGGVVARIW